MTTTTTLRPATIHDIVKRLTGPYKMTAETALATGMGDVTGIDDALYDAITLGVVRIVETRNTSYCPGVRMVALADGIHHCPTCIEGCEHGNDSAEGCEHWGCWSPNATGSCQGRDYAIATCGKVL